MDILFWSGGKDSFLALEFYRQEYGTRPLKLLTTYEQGEEIVPHQNIALKDIKKQALELGLDLLTVPLPNNCPNDLYLEKLEEVFQKEPEPVQHLVFGDWKNEELRNWRASVFGAMGYACLFPIWQKSLHDLLPVLLFKPIKVEISAVREEFRPYLRVGETYDQQLVRQLPREIDPMGENGEFHTKVIFRDLNEEVV